MYRKCFTGLQVLPEQTLTLDLSSINASDFIKIYAICKTANSNLIIPLPYCYGLIQDAALWVNSVDKVLHIYTKGLGVAFNTNIIVEYTKTTD